MKLKHYILFVTSLLAGIMSGCVDDENPSVDPTASVTVVMSTNDVQTKAAAGYTIATEDEINISKYMIAVFKDNACVAFVNRAPSTVGTTTDAENDNVKAYTESFTDLPTGELTFLVIANSNLDFSGFGVGTTYTSFEGLIETSTSLTATNLVKVGQVTQPLDPANTAKEVKVPLYQLTARIDIGTVKLDKAATEGSTTTVYSEWTATNAEESLNLLGISQYGSFYSNYQGFAYFYYYNTDESYLIKKRTATIITTSAPGNLKINSQSITGYNLKSSVPLLPDTTLCQNNSYEAGTVAVKDGTFYTYETSVAQAKMKVVLNCTIPYTSSSVTYTEYQSTLYRYIDGNWVASSTINEVRKSTSDSTTPSGDASTSADYTLDIPFNSTDLKILKGHRYLLHGTYEFVPNGKIHINWYVSKMPAIDNTIEFK